MEAIKEEEEEEVDVDINAMVARLEAKCANVREELGRMAVSEQYMRTKQAQLVNETADLFHSSCKVKSRQSECVIDFDQCFAIFFDSPRHPLCNIMILFRSFANC